MKQLALRNGDLVISGGSFAMVDGQAKVRQDLGCAMREPIGVDRFHPAWGSTLQSFVGKPIDETTEGLVRAEVQRVVNNYVLTRVAQMQERQIDGLQLQMGASEVVTDLKGVEIHQKQDRYNLRIHLGTLAGPVTLVSTVEA